MQSASQAVGVSKTSLWAGRIISALVVLFMVFDGVIKVLRLTPAVEGTLSLGYPVSVVFPLGIVVLVCVLLYVIPQSSVLGAILLTAYLGGAVATHVRVGNPLFSHVLFPTYVGVLAWLGLFLRDERLRDLIPLRRSATEIK
jgi:DoxX-like family